MTRTRRTTRTRQALWQRDPAGLTGATARLADGRLVHFGVDLGNLLVIETAGVPGYELALPSDEQNPAVQEWLEIIGSHEPRRMTVSQKASWERAAATVTTNDLASNSHWTATLDGDSGVAEYAATGGTPEEAVAALDAQTRQFDPNGPALVVLKKKEELYVTEQGSRQILGRIFRS